MSRQSIQSLCITIATIVILSALPMIALAAPVNCPSPPPGTVPVAVPTGGFGIDGDTLANTPTANIGDWFPGAGGTGGAVIGADQCSVVNSTTTAHLDDLENDANDNNFHGGLKVNDDPNVWTWVTNPVNDKQDLKHAFFHYGRSAGVDGHIYITVAATRFSNNGDSYIDFEFLHNSLTLTNPGGASGGFVSLGPDGGRTVGDFLITIQFTRGPSEYCLSAV